MRRGVDSNVLIYAHVPGLESHDAVRSFLAAQLTVSGLQLAVTPTILHEFIHIITDERRFEPPVSMSEATAVARNYLNRSNILCLATDEPALHLALHMVEKYRLGRRRLADTLFAATLLVNDIQELITCNPDDYRIFGRLHTIDPRKQADSPH